jgi:glycosidase
MSWSKQPVIYEINTWVWLEELSRAEGKRVTLASVPEEEWDSLADWGLDAVWLMGVWERSPRGVEIARADEGLRQAYWQALESFTDDDVVGSPYAVHRYEVDAHLGGRAGLAAARQALARRGMRLILDFVPNHTAVDHPWVQEHPSYYLPGLPHGRDPNFPAWTDTRQLNAAGAAWRRAAIETLRDIASQADGVRCDMAMLLLSDVFARTWGLHPVAEFWPEVIGQVRAAHPGFLFLAEAYWDLEWELQQQGFDLCYDKRLYDRLLHDNADSIRAHLTAGLDYQGRLVRFLENHDEPRAAAAFPGERYRAAAVVTATLPGARLYHEGQFTGARVRLPVQLGRRPWEAPDTELRAFYRKLLAVARARCTGQWRLCEVEGWHDNQSCRHLVAWTWSDGDRRTIVAVNLSAHSAQGRVRLPWPDLGGSEWMLEDPLAAEAFTRDGNDMRDAGLYVALDPWRCHFLLLDRPQAV